MPLTSLLDSLGAGFGFHVVNLGCKVNRVESDTISAALTAWGARSMPLGESSLVVVNTCTVTGEADKKARKAVRHALSVSPDAIVLVTGCAVAIDTDTFSSMDGRVRVVQRADLLSALNGLSGAMPLRIGQDYRTRVQIKVQDGCNRACTYCIVHVARGPATSVPLADVLDEAESYLARGVNEIVLTGIDLGSYSYRGAGLSQLVESLLEIADKHAQPGKPPARVRASSLEPQSVDEDFIRLLEQSQGKLCRHLHLPLQSGSSRVLREMARPYSAEGYVDLVAELYRRIPSMSISTDIICGFPGETDQDFSQTLQVARACRFSKIHVFPYSKRAGTPAAERADQVASDVKSLRCAQLRALSDELRSLDLSLRSGTSEYALVQGDTALTESYHEVSSPTDCAVGDLVLVSL